MTNYFDLSQPIEYGMTIFPGDPDFDTILAPGVTAPWQVTELHLGTHTGTHIDSVSHLVPGGKTVDEYPLARLILHGITIPLTGLNDDQEISEEQILIWLKNLPEGGAVIIQTGWDQFWKKDRYMRHPYLSRDAASQIVKAGASLVGIDALNVDSTVKATDHVHHILLEKDVLIVENLANLYNLEPGKEYQFSFLPLRLKGLDGSPIRAAAW
jgi:kynurenine formamidase